MKILFREFCDQFLISESVTSDHQLRTAFIGVIAFLITPGFLRSMQLSIPLEFFALRFPEMVEPFIRLNATIFITYGMVAMGVIAAFTWDALGFDRRDAMVLGPLPVSGATVITAKLGALAALLLAGAAAVNVMTAFPFAMVASNHTGGIAALRHFTGHMVATMCAATFVFCVLVTMRALVGMIGEHREAITSFVQFILVSAVLCYFVLAPAAVRITRGRRGTARVAMFEIPQWSPTNSERWCGRRLTHDIRSMRATWTTSSARCGRRKTGHVAMPSSKLDLKVIPLTVSQTRIAVLTTPRTLHRTLL